MIAGASAPARAAILCIALGAGLAAGGCGGPRFARTPTPATDLGGHWVLDPAASDDAAAAIAAVIPAARTAPARPQTQEAATAGSGDGSGRDRRGGGRGGGSTTGTRTSSAQAAPAAAPLSRRSVAELLRAFAQPSSRLDIASAPGRLAIVAGSRQRSFEPGADEAVAVTDRFGSRTVTAGWRNAEFMVVSVERQRLEVIEHYHAGSGDTLESDVQVSAAGLKRLKVHTVYRRATAAEIASPASDGPPAPGPR